MYINEPMKKYLDESASGASTPGGGSVAALAGALGAALMKALLDCIQKD